MSLWSRIFKQRQQKLLSDAQLGATSKGLGTASWTSRDYANFAKEAYLKNYVSFRCIDMIAQDVSTVPWGVFKRANENREEQANHPINKLLRRANPRQGFSSFQYSVISYWGIAGNSYVDKIGPITGPNKGVPKELYTQRPDLIKPLLDRQTNEHLGYVLEVNGTEKKRWEIDPITGNCDLLHIKKFHPLNDVEGLATVEPAARSIDTSNEALNWNKKLLQNDARPGTLFVFENPLGDDQYERFEKRLNERRSGSDNAGKNLIVEGALKDARPFGFSPMEMDYLQGNWDLARQICATYGVPPQLLGIPGDSTYANFEQARMYFWETTVFYYLQILKDEYNAFFFPDSDEIFVDFDLDDIPALMPRRLEKFNMIEKASFLKVNEKREEMGKEEAAGGDVILVPSTMIPLDMVSVEEEDVDDAEEEVEEEIDEELQAIIMEEKEEPEELKPYSNEHACRLQDPNKFDSFRRKNNAAKINGKRVDHIYGIKAGKSNLQAVRFPKNIWSAADAKKHCEGTFEAAKS